MDFSIKAKEAIATLLADEMGQLIAAAAITDLLELEQGLRLLLRDIGQQAYGKILENEDQKQAARLGCGCGVRAQRISQRGATVLTVFGRVHYRRSYYGCPDCGQKQYPLDHDWGLRPGEVSPVLGKLLAIAGVDVAFERARRKVAEFLLIEVSDNTIRKQTQLIGEKQAQCEAQWIQDSHDEAWLQQRQRSITGVPERLYGSIDGAQVPIGSEWRELKALCWYQVAAVYGQAEPKAQTCSYHTEIAPAEDFGRLLWATGLRHLADQAPELIFVCDGAAWIWNLVTHYFPQAIQIVDWYHACEYLTPIATTAFASEAAQKAWLERVTAWLWEGDIPTVLRACQAHCQHPQAGEAAQRAVTYYTNNQHRMDYATFRQHGYWIGSGTIESGCKQIATARLKIAGARWLVPGAIATAKARAAWLSGDETFNSLANLPLAV